MDFDKELDMLLEFSDYNTDIVNVIKQEAIMLNRIYPELKPNRGWGKIDKHTISLIGRIPLERNGTYYMLPFGICFPTKYPNVPPLCNVIPGNMDILIASKRVLSTGAITIKLFENWNNNYDSLEVVQSCIKHFTKHPPTIDIGAEYLRESWALRREIEDLNKEKSALNLIKKEVNIANDLINVLLDSNAINELKTQQEDMENWIKANENEDFEFSNALIYSGNKEKIMAELLAEEESFEETVRKLTEAFYMKVLCSTDFIYHLKELFNAKFMLIKKREKLSHL
ncbi:hypothetical protein SteCoe_28889 [Stentor coeruleus]|uniref:UEV domain-containing protein n=1 Tax=Stentor coeruleus TaxID=5963 RepID=A0A1R2B7I1_9CILI|nr:hypothetical protein SteCoe_28889 [Stentor coeruleus]